MNVRVSHSDSSLSLYWIVIFIENIVAITITRQAFAIIATSVGAAVDAVNGAAVGAIAAITFTKD